MALNKYMHPRNVYKIPPDFGKLAKLYEEFSSVAKTDITGKVTVDFKNPHCLRVLTKCLLKSDFGLDVVIPEDRLVPTLPLRLNYILWIEDLMNAIDRTDNIKGLDIGTGACAIYPLLAAKKNKWHMVGTESDIESVQKAQENIDRNNLQNLIQICKNGTSTLLEYLVTKESTHTFDFCMCNPPFYSNVQELCESRSPARLPPKNAFTGSPQELITEGGELTFCRKIIKESKVLKDKVIIFSTMVGHKFNLKELVQDVKADGIKHTTTEFCQGRVTRWGLAWTYQEYDIDKLVPGRDKLRKKHLPVVYLLPELESVPYNFDTVSEKLFEILKKLNLEYKVFNKKGNQLSLDVRAVENTWSNQRRKRRLMKLQQDGAKKSKPNQSSDTVDAVPTTNLQSDADNKMNTKRSDGERHPGSSVGDSKKYNITEKNSVCDIELDNKTNESFEGNNDNTSESTNNTKKETEVNMSKLNQNNSLDDRGNSVSECSKANFSANISKAEPLVHSFFKLLKKDYDILLEMEFLDGTAGKEGVHQIMQYIKNNWK